MFVSIKLEKIRNFKYGMRAIKIIEDITGKAMGQIDMENMTMETLSIMVYAGLAHEDKELTPDKVIDLIDEYSDIQTVAETMAKAIEQAFNNGKNVQRVAVAKK